MTCARIGCDRHQYSRQHCRPHYELWRRTGRLGSEPDCDLVDATPLVATITRLADKLSRTSDGLVGVKTIIPDGTDRRAWYRAKKAGVVREVVADRILVRWAGLTIDEVY
jgi:hypothetical protein